MVGIFSGNPGTAKTTVARLFARIMRENGLLSKGQLVEVGRGDLIAKYVGWTAQNVQSKFKAAKGGVLFIDEAYSLVDDAFCAYAWFSAISRAILTSLRRTGQGK